MSEVQIKRRPSHVPPPVPQRVSGSTAHVGEVRPARSVIHSVAVNPAGTKMLGKKPAQVMMGPHGTQMKRAEDQRNQLAHPAASTAAARVGPGKPLNPAKVAPFVR